jgi:hypothetical protein
MISESGHVGMLLRTINGQKKVLWTVIVAHFFSAHSPSKGSFNISCPYTLKLTTISWPAFPLARLRPILHYTFCGSDWLIHFSIFHVWPLTPFCETYQFPDLVYFIPENGGSSLIRKFLQKFISDLKL